MDRRRNKHTAQLLEIFPQYRHHANQKKKHDKRNLCDMISDMIT